MFQHLLLMMLGPMLIALGTPMTINLALAVSVIAAPSVFVNTSHHKAVAVAIILAVGATATSLVGAALIALGAPPARRAAAAARTSPIALGR